MFTLGKLINLMNSSFTGETIYQVWDTDRSTGRRQCLTVVTAVGLSALLHEYPLPVGRRGSHFSGSSAGATLRE